MEAQVRNLEREQKKERREQEKKERRRLKEKLNKRVKRIQVRKPNRLLTTMAMYWHPPRSIP
jgi:cellobiose phosphorylase